MESLKALEIHGKLSDEQREYFRNDGKRKLPGVVIQEDKYLSHLRQGNDISLILSNNFLILCTHFSYAFHISF